MHRVLVLGAGKIGSLVACLFSESGDYEVSLGDISLDAPKRFVENLVAPGRHADDPDVHGGVERPQLRCGPFTLHYRKTALPGRNSNMGWDRWHGGQVDAENTKLPKNFITRSRAVVEPRIVLHV